MGEPSLLAYVAGRTGMKVSGAQQRRLTRVLSRACQESGMSPPAYAELLRRDQAAFDALAAEVTVGETYFFRERPQLELLRDAVQDGRPQDRPLRVWSAGCSTGEEAYTLGMLLGADAAHPGTRVLGTDLSPAALARATRAAYGERALRAVADDERTRWFEPGPRGQVQVREPVRRAVRFARGNLLDGSPEPLGFDVVLCRNVLIYLSSEAVSRVAVALRDALLPSGWLLTGVADPVLEADGLERVATAQGVMYRQAGRTAQLPRRPRQAPPSTAPAAPTLPAVQHRAPLTRPAPPPGAERVPAPPPATAVTVTPDQPTPAAAPLAAARAAVEAAPLDAALRYRLAVLHLEDGDLRSAAETATAAVFLEPGFVVAHLLLGRVHEGLRAPGKAQRCFRTAASLLDQLPGHLPVPHAGGETAETLARVVGTALSPPAQSRKGHP